VDNDDPQQSSRVHLETSLYLLGPFNEQHFMRILVSRFKFRLGCEDWYLNYFYSIGK